MNDTEFQMELEAEAVKDDARAELRKAVRMAFYVLGEKASREEFERITNGRTAATVIQFPQAKR